jgi:hypothetical protein
MIVLGTTRATRRDSVCGFRALFEPITRGFLLTLPKRAPPLQVDRADLPQDLVIKSASREPSPCVSLSRLERLAPRNLQLRQIPGGIRRAQKYYVGTITVWAFARVNQFEGACCVEIRKERLTLLSHVAPDVPARDYQVLLDASAAANDSLAIFTCSN